MLASTIDTMRTLVIQCVNQRNRANVISVVVGMEYCNAALRTNRMCGLKAGHNGNHRSYESMVTYRQYKRNREAELRKAGIKRDVMALRRKRRDELDQYKLDKGCKDCGYADNPIALEFDHRNPDEKVANVSFLVNSASYAALWDEVAKCDVRCCNCHQIRTHAEKHPGYYRHAKLPKIFSKCPVCGQPGNVVYASFKVKELHLKGRIAMNGTPVVSLAAESARYARSNPDMQYAQNVSRALYVAFAGNVNEAPRGTVQPRAPHVTGPDIRPPAVAWAMAFAGIGD